MIDWMLTWTTVLAISTGLMAFAIIVTAVYAVIQLIDIRRTRCSNLLMQIYQTWDSDEYIKSRTMINQHCCAENLHESPKKLKEAMKAYEDKDAEEYYIMLRVANFFENLGFLGYKKYLNKNDAIDLFGDTAENYWNLFSAMAKYDKCEREDRQPEAWVYFEELALGFPNKKERLLKIEAFFRRILGKLH